MGERSELQAEQAYVDRAYEALAERRARAASLRESAATRSLRTLYERDERVAASRRRDVELDLGDRPLCFGRIDQQTDATAPPTTWYVGRTHVDGDDGEPLVIDWRAPVAAPFYRATRHDPLGVVRRRHLHCVGREVRALDDELLSGDDRDEAIGASLVGEAALFRALSRRRSGRMGDVAATIQADQDRAVRAPLSGVLVVQGGPGTGKTAVALHRAAYLFYAHREELEAKGVLVVGPNTFFIRYIERVLPSLGESGAVYRTPATLREVPSESVLVDEPADVAMIKGRADMAAVMVRAVEARQRPLPRAERVAFGAYRLAVGPRVTERIIEEAKAVPGRHNERRALVERRLLGALHRRYVAAVDRARAARLRPERARSKESFADVARSSPDVQRLLDRMWPVLTAEQALGDLYRHVPLWRDAAAGVLEPAARERIADHLEAGAANRASRVGAWSVGDIALLDELDVILGPVPTPRRVRTPQEDRDWMADRVLDGVAADADVSMSASMAAEIRERIRANEMGTAEPERPRTVTRSFGHVVVDEAQDVSPMQWRMLARRCPSGSFTVVGDLGQASAGWRQGWEAVIDALGRPPGSAVVELLVNYRTPAEVMELAERVLAAAAPDVAAPASVRSNGRAPDAVHVAPAELVDEAARRAATMRAEIDGGTVAVLAPPSMLDTLRVALDVDPSTRATGREAIDEPVALLAVGAVKGLEFDGVVVVEPARIAARDDGGLLELYIAMTRTTDQLALVHAETLPLPLTGGMQDRPDGWRCPVCVDQVTQRAPAGQTAS